MMSCRVRPRACCGCTCGRIGIRKKKAVMVVARVKMRLGWVRRVVLMVMVIVGMTRNMGVGSPVEVHFFPFSIPQTGGVFITVL